MNYRQSMLTADNFCQTKFKLEYLDKLESKIQSADMLFGTTIHLSLTKHFEGEDPISQFNTMWGAVENDLEYTYGRYKWAELKEIGIKMLTNWIKLQASRFEPLYIEKKLAQVIQGFTVEGTPDFIGNFKGKLSVVDFKTSLQLYDNEQVRANDQLYLYAHLAELTYGITIEQVAYMVFVKSQQRIQTLVLDLKREHLKDMLANITNHIQSIATRTNFTKNRANCINKSNKCPYFENCYGGNEND